METKISVRKSEEMQEVAADPTVPIPEELYYMIRCPGMNVTVIPEYRLGQEYPKTYGHLHEPEAEEIYEILYGEAIMLLQRGIDRVEEVRLITLKKGDSITVAKGYAHALINIGEGPLVTIDDYDPANFSNDYEKIKRKHGFAYYIVEDDEGRPKAVPNPLYEEVPPVKYE